jgi:UDP-N-acetyl-D-mannosaminuronate dehydrogenase
VSIPPDTHIAIIGLGYVGLPLAVEFGKRYPVIGFDLSQPKIDAYNRHIDPTGEISPDDLKAAVRAGGLEPTTDARRLASADFLIIAVPTPVDIAHTPDFRPAHRGQHHRRPTHEEGRYGHLRIHRLPRRYRRNLHPRAGKALRP